MRRKREAKERQHTLWCMLSSVCVVLSFLCFVPAFHFFFFYRYCRPFSGPCRSEDKEIHRQKFNIQLDNTSVLLDIILKRTTHIGGGVNMLTQSRWFSQISAWTNWSRAALPRSETRCTLHQSHDLWSLGIRFLCFVMHYVINARVHVSHGNVFRISRTGSVPTNGVTRCRLGIVFRWMLDRQELFAVAATPTP